MTLASDIVADLDTMFDGWGDAITVGGTPYNGHYEAEYVELVDMQGFKPVFTMKTADVATASIAQGTSVTVTSVIAGITDKAFTVGPLQDMRDGVTKLILVEA